MAAQINSELLNKPTLFRGLKDDELAQIASLCSARSYKVGEICQEDGKSEERVHFIIKGMAGVAVRFPNVPYGTSEVIIENLLPGDSFGWSTLIGRVPWSTLKVMEEMDVIFIETEDLLKLCNDNKNIGFVVMKNLAGLVATKFRHNRMSILNAIVALKGA
jgi:signal-transduction protein with cAMP-binding, CBS, and nucleotidyltransferase domain